MNVTKLPVNRLKTADEFQRGYEEQYKWWKKVTLPWIFFAPLILVSGCLTIAVQFMQVSKNSISYIGAFAIYCVIVAGLYISIVRTEKPAKDEGDKVRRLLLASRTKDSSEKIELPQVFRPSDTDTARRLFVPTVSDGLEIELERRGAIDDDYVSFDALRTIQHLKKQRKILFVFLAFILLCLMSAIFFFYGV